MLTEHPLLTEPSSVSFYNWMSNAVGNRTGGGTQDSPVNRSQHNSLQTGERRNDALKKKKPKTSMNVEN